MLAATADLILTETKTAVRAKERLMSPFESRPAARAPGFQPPIVTSRGGKSGVAYRSTQAHVQYWMGGDIAVELDAERLLTAYSAWSALAARGLPSLRDLLQSEAGQADADSLLYLKVDDDYLIVSQGADRLRHRP